MVIEESQVIAINSPSSTIGASSRTTLWRRFRRSFLVRQQTITTESSPADRFQRLDLIRKYGDFSLAYTTAVQPGLEYFGTEHGYLAYGQRFGYRFVLGDPVALPQHREQLIKKFVTQYRDAAFCQISASTAEIVQQYGYYVNEMGVDTILELPEYDFHGQDKKWLRTAEAWTHRRGYTTREATLEQVGPEQVELVSQAWRTTRPIKRKEVRFLNRPMAVSDEPGTRRFYFFDSEQRMLAFVFFDPLYRAGQLIGYVACTKRRHPEAPVYAEQAIMKHCIEVFRREGCRELRMGLSPLAWIEDREFAANRLVNMLFRCGFSSRWVNKCFYNCQGHAEYKRRFRGREEKVYFASKSLFNTTRLLALIALCKII